MKQPPKLAKDFWQSFQKNSTLAISFAQLIAIGCSAAVLYYFGFYETHQTAFFIILGLQLITSTIVALFVYHFVSHPLKDLLAAVIHVSGEPTNLTPPNVNASRYAKNGFKDVLQTVFELASNAKTTPATDTPSVSSGPQSLVVSALDAVQFGFITMNRKRQIVYANKAAPINITQEGEKQLALIFNGQETLDAWLDECDKEAVHAEHTWTRLSNKLPEEEDRRFFDLVASYNKGSENEVVLTLIDRTPTYISGEQDLDFIAFAAHELRGPITVIRGYLDVLQDELDQKLEADQKELFRRLTVSANRLSGYINNILNTSRYDRRHLRMHLVEAPLSAIYDSIKDDMDMRASAQGRLLSVNFPTGLPTIAADPNSLSEVFGNLIDNAIKYSNEGGAIAVTAAVRGDFVDVMVEDHGIGMPGNVVSNLFQKFYRSHRSRETVAGTGIGLYISKAIVESHGGAISVRSEEGKGTTFTVSLPTFQSVADKLKAGDNSNESFIEQGGSFINNHSMYRG